MPEAAALAGGFLIVGIAGRLCAVPLTNVVETMRPLPTEAIGGAPSFVAGVSIIRGMPTPVVDLGTLLGAPKRRGAGRFVTVRAGNQQVALIADTVLGIRRLDELMTARQLPPLLQGVAGDVVETIGTLDDTFLVVLQSAWKLPNEVWESMATQGVLS
jgi:purine-binding chemotaxis protein CheW